MKKKRIVILTSITLVSALTVACSNKETQPIQTEKEISNPTQATKVTQEIHLDLLTDVSKPNDYIFTIKNLSEKELNFRFNSSQKLDYVVSKEDGTEVKRFSKDKMFTQAIEEVSVNPNETYFFGLVELNDLEPGTYKVKIWATLKNKPYQLEKSIDVN